MLAFAINRILFTLPIAIGVSIVCFLLLHLAPGDPASAVIPENVSPEIAARIRADYGFDQPLFLQYLRWLARVLTGDFGVSIMTRRPVAAEVGPAIVNTLKLAAGAMLIGCGLGVGLGAYGAYRAGAAADRIASAIGITGISIPQYWLGMVLIVAFAVDLSVLPANGMGEPNAALSDQLRHLILPTITLSLLPAGVIAKSVRSSVVDILRQDYVQALHAKGLRPRLVFWHVARNAAAPVLAVIGLQLAHLLGGSILVETVFSWPGTGFLLHSAIFTRDLPVLQGTIIVLAGFFLLTNLTADLAQMALDPRMRRARALRGMA